MTKRTSAPCRNVGIIAHVDAGKTTLTESMLFEAGAIHRAGSVDAGTTATDHSRIEREKGITINAAAVHFEWKGTGVNLIDTPGHADFTMEVERSLRVLDGALLLIDAVAGVEPQTEKVWRQADRYGVPRICFVNKMDRLGADLDRALDSLREHLGVRPVVIDGDRSALVDACADVCPAFEETFLAHGEVDRPMTMRALREGVAAGRLLPVVAGSAARQVGVGPILDAICDLLPPPTTSGGPTRAFCFKVSFATGRQLTFVRVYEGELRAGARLYSSTMDRVVRVGRLVRVFGDRLEDVDVLAPGAIGAIVGGDHRTGETLSAPDHRASMEGVAAPEPLLHLAIEAKRPSERDRIDRALTRLLIEDPSLVRRYDAETGQDLLGGIGQLHLEVSLSKLRQTGVDVTVGRPRVALRSTLERAIETRHRHVKRTGGPGQFAEIALRLEPIGRGAGVVFEDRTVGGALTSEYVRGTQSGVREALNRGRYADVPVTDVRVVLVDGASHSHDSSELAFKVAAEAAVRDAIGRTDIVMLEPIMTVDVETPTEHIGAVLADLERRRARVTGVADTDGTVKHVAGRVPLAELFDYATGLASLTRGRARFDTTLSGYERVS